MTDIDAWRAFLASQGVRYTEHGAQGGAAFIRIGSEGLALRPPRIGGEIGHYTDVEFDDAGAFVQIGAWA